MGKIPPAGPPDYEPSGNGFIKFQSCGYGLSSLYRRHFLEVADFGRMLPGQIYLMKHVHLLPGKTKIQAEFFLTGHRIFQKHIQLGVAGIFGDRQNSRHVCQREVGFSFQQVKRTQIGPPVLLCDEGNMEDGISLVRFESCNTGACEERVGIAGLGKISADEVGHNRLAKTSGASDTDVFLLRIQQRNQILQNHSMNAYSLQEKCVMKNL